MKTFAISAIAATLFTTAAMASTVPTYTQSYDANGNIQVSDTSASTYQGGTYKPAAQGQTGGSVSNYNVGYDGNGNIVISDASGAHRATLVTHNTTQPSAQQSSAWIADSNMVGN